MKQLRIASDLRLPVDVAGEAIAILAKRGAGKTNTATVLVEELVRAGVQTVVVDPVGAWWGIRSSAAGEKGAGLEVPIIGGQHGDVPLEQTAGHLIADVVVDSGQSMLLDLSDFPSKQATAQFVVEFAQRLYTRKARSGSLLHLVLEEADVFAPQKVGRGSDPMMAWSIEQIVRRGRSRGLGVTMITQRSAVLNKDVLTQADVLIVMRTTGPTDIKAIREWVAARGDEHGEQVIASLPSLETGEAWIWNPERDLLKRAKIRRRRTFDSSATPKAGEKRAEPGDVASIDLTALGEQIAATVERAKDNDPRELRQQIRTLKKQLAERPAETVVEERVVEKVVEVPVLDGQVDDLERAVAAMRELAGDLAAAGEHVHAGAAAIADAINRWTTKETPDARPHARAGQAAPQDRGAARQHRGDARHHHPREDRRAVQRAASSAPVAAVDGDFRPSGPQQRILNALAALDAIGVPEAAKVQLALFAEASPKSSSYTNNLGALRTAGLIDYPAGGRVTLTDAGRAIADAGGAPSSTDELHDFVYRLVGGAKARLLQVLVSEYPGLLTKGELAERAGASATSSSFTNNLGSLRSLGLIDYPSHGIVGALPVLFLE